MILIDKWLHRNSVNRLKCNFGNVEMTIFKWKQDFTHQRQIYKYNIEEATDGLSFACLMKRISIKIQLNTRIPFKLNFKIWNIWSVYSIWTMLIKWKSDKKTRDLGVFLWGHFIQNRFIFLLNRCAKIQSKWWKAKQFSFECIKLFDNRSSTSVIQIRIHSNHIAAKADLIWQNLCGKFLRY